jgi:hypothetical protein
VRDGKVDLGTALQYATNEGNFRLMLSDFEAEPEPDPTGGPHPPSVGECGM